MAQPGPKSACDTSSARREAPNGDIALRRAAHDAAGGESLGYALIAEPRCIAQARRISWKNPRQQAALAKRIAKRYFPRGPLQRDAMADRLSRAGRAIAEHRIAGDVVEHQDRAAKIVFCGISAFAYTVDGPANAGDPQRAAKNGATHNLSRTLAIGASLIVRRGTEQCLTAEYTISDSRLLELKPIVNTDGVPQFYDDGQPRLEACPNKAGPSGYCARCISDDSLAHRRDARRKIIETTVRYAPRLYGQPRARRLSRASERPQPASEPKPAAIKPPPVVPATDHFSTVTIDAELAALALAGDWSLPARTRDLSLRAARRLLEPARETP